MEPVLLNGLHLSLEEVALVAAGRAVEITPEARDRIARARAVVDAALERGDVAYGVTTGFGELSSVRVDPADAARLQVNLLRSHAAGVGPPLPREAVRAMLLLRAATLARGYSGVRAVVVERLVDLLNHDVLPVVPSQGSVGASGDLAPLAHAALVLIGEGRATYRGETLSGGEALTRAGLAPLTLAAKEGLSLINGTQTSTALAALHVVAAERLAAIADLSGAMSLQALLGTDRAFDPRIHELRPHPGQLAAAANLRRLTASSPLIASHHGCGRVQDAYSLRCMPQVHGAARDAIAHARGVVAIEIDAVTDNPIVFPVAGDMISGGNFHGEPVAMAMDFLAIGLAELANISERRIERLTNPQHSAGLPAFLVEHGGLNSGFMIAHVTAAALVAENKVLCHPASVDSLPTSAGKEDHVSFSTHAARKAGQVLENLSNVLAIELLAASQGLSLRRPLVASPPCAAALAQVRERVAYWDVDREMASDIAAARAIIVSGALGAVAEGVADPGT